MEGVNIQLDAEGHGLITNALLGDYSLLFPFAEHLGDGIYRVNSSIVGMTVSYSFEQLNMYTELLASGSEELNVPNLLADNRGFIAIHILQTAYLVWLLANNTPPPPPKRRRKSTQKPDADFYVAESNIRS